MVRNADAKWFGELMQNSDRRPRPLQLLVP
jgi:hypothetical protein